MTGERTIRKHTAVLYALLKEVFDEDEIKRIKEFLPLTDGHFQYTRLVEFDTSIKGLGIHNINRLETGNYNIDDRDVFRPIQYCATYFKMESEVEWLSREIIHMCGLHLESLLKRITGLKYAPLGQALRHKIAQRKIPKEVWVFLIEYLNFYNSAKHDIPREAETHLFSPEDAVLGYLIARRLGSMLLQYGRLKTPIAK